MIIPTLALLGWLAARNPSALHLGLLIWIAGIAIVGLLPVPGWRGLQMSMGFPLLIAVALIYAPVAGGVAAFVGSFDPREFRKEVTLLRALFNRAQVALSVLAAGGVFHAITTVYAGWHVVVPTAALAALTDYAVNSALVSMAVRLAYRVRIRDSLRSMRIGRSAEFFISYLGLGFTGAVLAKFYVVPEIGAWALPAVVTPLVFARQMFFRSRALEEAHQELKERELVLRALSDRMAEERQDERQQIAAYLHDDLAQLLFRLSLQVDVARKHLRAGDAATVEQDLEDIRRTKTRTADLVRALIRDLHRSPLGRAGLAEAISSFTEDLAGDSGVAFHIDVDDLPLAPAVQLLVYHIAREAITNALRHAASANVWVSLKPEEDDVVLTLRDDGVGFDPAGLEDEGHFGLAMMRERAQLVGGTLALASAPGEGATVTVRFPASWLGEPQPAEEEAPEHSSQPGPSIEPADPAVAPPARSQGPDEPEDAVGGGEIEEQVPVQGADVP